MGIFLWFYAVMALLTFSVTWAAVWKVCVELPVGEFLLAVFLTALLSAVWPTFLLFCLFTWGE
jgi:hypothetical protein